MTTARLFGTWLYRPDRLRRALERLDKGPDPETRKLRSMNAAQPSVSDLYQVYNKTAVIHINEDIDRYAYWYGIAPELIREMLADARDRADIDRIALVFDSYGGRPEGVQQSAAFIREVAQTKPVIGIIDGAADSAAYWLAAACSQLYLADETSEAGSIGVVLAHIDRSKALEERGWTITHITSGKYKSMGNSTEPLDEETLAYLQTQVEDIYRPFAAAVAEYRGLPVATIDAMEAQIYIGPKAVEAGLVDGIMTLQELIDGGTTMAAARETTPQVEERPEARGDAIDKALTVRGPVGPAGHRGPEGPAGPEAKGDEIQKALAAERGRIQTIMTNAPEGLRELAEEHAFVKLSTPEVALADFLKQVKAAEQAERDAILSGYQKPIPQDPPKTEAAPPNPQAKPKSNDFSLSVDDAWNEEMQARFHGNKKRFAAWYKAQQRKAGRR
ncbi:MAG: S49 family peptidase [Acidobacteriota bacterium]|nr:S49 family peptidase [Acidobacteriota bacterium]